MAAPRQLNVSDDISPLLENSPVLLGMVHPADTTPKFKWVSPSIETLLGYSTNECLSENWWLENIHPDDRQQVEFQFQRALRTGTDRVMQFRFMTKNGQYRHIRSHIHFNGTHDNGNDAAVYQVWTDSTDTWRTNQQMQSLQRAYALLTGSIEAALTESNTLSLYKAVCDLAISVGQYQLAWVGLVDHATDRIKPVARAGTDRGYIDQVSASVNASKASGCGPVGTAIRQGQISICDDIMTESDMRHWRDLALHHNFRSMISLPIRIEDRVAGVLIMYSSKPHDFDQQERELLEQLANDLSAGVESIYEQQQRTAAEDRLRHLAFYNELTGLARLSYIRETLGENPELLQQGGACLIIQLDNLSDYNHVLGYNSGDEILKIIAARLRDRLGEDRLVAHIAGAKFLVLAPGISDRAQVNQHANDILELISEPVVIHNIPIEASARIGYDVQDRDSDFETLLRNSDLARVYGFENHLHTVAYSPEFETDPGRLQLITELRHAVERRELVLRYQPKLDLDTDRICGVEALVRWHHPQKGLIPPADFIELAEYTGIITNITLYVIQQGLQDLQTLNRNGYDLHIAINVSANDLRNSSFAGFVIDTLKRYELAPDLLTLELTETAIMHDIEQCREVLSSLAEFGVNIAIDDFGTGYSSLTYLARLPIDSLKIDRTFLGQWDTPSRAKSIVRSTINMASGLSVRSTAEGVEYASWLGELRDMGCHEAQGFGIAKPMELQSLIEWLPAYGTSKDSE